MTPAFQRSIDRLFAHMGKDAEYQTLGQQKQPIRVIVRQQDPMVELNDRPLHVNLLLEIVN